MKLDRVDRGFFSNTMRSRRGQADNFRRGGARKGTTTTTGRASTTTVRENRSNRERLFTDGLHKNTTTE